MHGVAHGSCGTAQNRSTLVILALTLQNGKTRVEAQNAARRSRAHPAVLIFGAE